MEYGNRDAYVRNWMTFIERPDGTDFVQNAPLTYRRNSLYPAERPLGYRQDFGPNRRPQSGAVN